MWGFHICLGLLLPLSVSKLLCLMRHQTVASRASAMSQLVTLVSHVFRALIQTALFCSGGIISECQMQHHKHVAFDGRPYL